MENQTITNRVNEKHKSSVFSMLFSDPAVLRELYSAIEGVELPENIPININTLSNVFIKGKLNDISFIVDNRLVVLIEHQSTINENMPFRLLEYIERVYKSMIDWNKLFQKSIVRIPRPEFIVLYNGVEDYPEKKELRLSDAFPKIKDLKADDNGVSLELVVNVYNINKGFNLKILEKSAILGGYCFLVDKIRECINNGQDLVEAVKFAVKYCVENNILSDFLKKHAMEVMNMMLDEITLEDEIEAYKRAAREDGLEEGRAEGRAEGREERNLEIARRLIARGRSLEEIAEDTNLPLETLLQL